MLQGAGTEAVGEEEEEEEDGEATEEDGEGMEDLAAIWEDSMEEWEADGERSDQRQRGRSSCCCYVYFEINISTY